MSSLGVPYIPAPPWAKGLEFTLFLINYAVLVVLGALLASESTPAIIEMQPIPTHLGVVTVGATIAVSSLLAMFGVSIHQYRFEWIALSPLVASILIIAVSAITAGSYLIGLTSILVSSMLGVRLLRLILMARRLREDVI